MIGNKGKYILGYSFMAVIMAVIFASSLFFYFGWKNLTNLKNGEANHKKACEAEKICKACEAEKTAEKICKTCEAEKICEACEARKTAEKIRKALCEQANGEKRNDQLKSIMVSLSSTQTSAADSDSKVLLQNMDEKTAGLVRHIAENLYNSLDQNKYEELLQIILDDPYNIKVKEIFFMKAMQNHLGYNYLSSKTRAFISKMQEADAEARFPGDPDAQKQWKEKTTQYNRLYRGSNLFSDIVTYCFVDPEFIPGSKEMFVHTVPLHFDEEMAFLRNEDNLLLAACARIFSDLNRDGSMFGIKEQFDMTEFRKFNKIKTIISGPSLPHLDISANLKNIIPYLYFVPSQIENRIKNATGEVERRFWIDCLAYITNRSYDATSVTEEGILMNAMWAESFIFESKFESYRQATKLGYSQKL